MPKWEDNKFEVSLGRMRSASGSRRTVGFFEQVSRGAKAKRRTGRASRSVSSSAKPIAFYRRVVVKASIKKMLGRGFGSFKQHLDYIQRDGTNEKGDKAEAYGRGVESLETDLTDEFSLGSEKELSSIQGFAERCKDDRHHFRFIVAPEDGSKLLSLTEFTQDLVAQMETDLDTKLDWVAANHYDTGQPHTHLVIRGVRDNGKDLVIPRQYISQTLRQRAQDLVEMELGPVTQIEGRVRVAHQINAQRFTGIDKSISDALNKGELNFRGPAPKGRVWYRQLQVKRLQKLSQMGLAEKLTTGRWKVEPDFDQTLKDMGERSDIIKAINRSLKDEGLARRLVIGKNRYDPSRLAVQPLEGVVKQFGRHDDTREGGYVVIQSLHGEHIHTKVPETETFETLAKGQVITLQPHPKGARKIDHSIAEFANSHDGVYSKVHHVTEGGNVSPAYAQAHVRRLEALRRENLVVRQQDGTWRIPHDYLERASYYESEKAMRMPTSIDRLSTQTIAQMEKARGATWLDKKMSETTADTFSGTKMQTSILRRQAILKQMGFNFTKEGRLPKEALEKLQDMDLRDAARNLSKVYSKPYLALGSARSVEGVYQKAIDRPSGKFAVIERSKDFTLVPWRPVMERNLGKSLSGRISAGGISWNVSKQRGLSR